MNVIVIVGSKHGSTRLIAKVVGDELRNGGLDVSIVDADADISLDGFDAAVIGSAVYFGRWMKDAQTFLEAHREALRRMPLWLFSSGPLSHESEQPDELADVQAFADDVGARDHDIFAGSLDKANLSFAERVAVRVVHVHDGNVCEWAEIRLWAATIAAELTRPLMSLTSSS